jgi:hypothetical protein
MAGWRIVRSEVSQIVHAERNLKFYCGMDAGPDAHQAGSQNIYRIAGILVNRPLANPG